NNVWSKTVCINILVSLQETVPRVTGGHEATPYSHPYMVSLQKRLLWFRLHICGGSIISKNRILTAAHCVSDSFVMKWLPLDAIAGIHNNYYFGRQAQIRTIFKKYPHPDYNGYSILIQNCCKRNDNRNVFFIFTGRARPIRAKMLKRALLLLKCVKIETFFCRGIGSHDIAVLYTFSPFKFTRELQPISLPNDLKLDQQLLTISGWGLLSTSMFMLDFPEKLQEIEVTYLPYEDCYEAIEGVKDEDEINPLNAETHICTGPITGGVAACSGDSGGPLVLHIVKDSNATKENDSNEGVTVEDYYNSTVVLLGIVSWGLTPCGEEGAPTIHTKVSSYLDFINQHLRK
ncbi:PREDICTED: glandular kallikrein-like, partial [Papilio xuthus]|uniref:Glandular kallikrein-like n=1 Tax=Papilio xuthus TaxID=66420 RepID=A0AAJ7EK28_PAPXU